MIEPQKLFQLSGGQKRRKLALSFGALERDIAGIAEKGTEYNFNSMTREQYVKELVKVLLLDPKLPKDAASELNSLLNENPFNERRTCNIARNHLLAIIGTFPAEWDLIIAPHKGQIELNKTPDLSKESDASSDSHDTITETSNESKIETRKFYPGVCAYAEDIRSPFNLGSIFRTAEGLGAEKLYLSPFCCDETHPRAVRSGMGCIETLPYEKKSLDELPTDKPIFVLETGGTPIDEFKFPKEGICIIGSEELGVSPEAIKKATYGCVTIPMIGLKASLNVGVAFGILMQKWVESLNK
ncbi:MAG: TrmH family RNA methyltransferase [Treponema sp.]|nr:TrmH family RNA methyltransferase [Candidatus Treponema merdequi]